MKGMQLEGDPGARDDAKLVSDPGILDTCG
jgi:hypothetical protein